MSKVTKVRSHIRRTKSGKETVVREHTRRVKSRIPESVFRRKVEELKKKIFEYVNDDYDEFCKELKVENGYLILRELSSEGEVGRVYKTAWDSEFSDFARKTLEKYDIHLYDDDNYRYYKYILKILKATNEVEFLEALKEYVNELKRNFEISVQLTIKYYKQDPRYLYESVVGDLPPEPDSVDIIFKEFFDVSKNGQNIRKAFVIVEKRKYMFGKTPLIAYFIHFYDRYDRENIFEKYFATTDEMVVSEFINFVKKLFVKYRKGEIDSVTLLDKIDKWIIQKEEEKRGKCGLITESELEELPYSWTNYLT